MKPRLSKIRDFPGYYVSDNGEVFSCQGNDMRMLKPHVKNHGSPYVTLFRNGKRHYPRVCRLVAEAFIPNPDNLPEVNHKDEDKTNNQADNLAWCSARDSWKGQIARKKSDPSIQNKNNTSGRKGVSKMRNVWRAYFGGKYLGTFKTFEEAVSAREKAETEANACKR